MNRHPLQDRSRAGVFRFSTGNRDLLLDAARMAGLKPLEADLEGCQDKSTVLAKLGRDLHLPDWYGGNFDALHDCLTDPEWDPAPGYLLLLSGLETWHQADPHSFSMLTEVFQSIADVRRDKGIPFWILMDTTSADIAPLSNS